MSAEIAAPSWQPRLDAYCPALSRAGHAAARFVADMGEDSGSGRWLTFSGVPGCGKSMLARQILEASTASNPGWRAIWLGKRPRPACVWIDATEFAERLKGGDYGMPERYRDDWCVVFDDLGTARDKSDFIADGIFRFCSSRIGLWTVFTTNLRMDEIHARVDARVASRLIRDDNELITIEAQDYAIVQRQRRAQASKHTN